MKKYTLVASEASSEDEDALSSPAAAEKKQELKVYRNRWVMLAILTLLTAENISQWLFYSAISNIVMYHYNISSFAAQTLSLNNLVIGVFFNLPSTFLVHNTDLKVGCMLSGALSLAALWIKYLGTGPGGFYITLCGQIVASIGTFFVLPLPAQLASTWFGPLERSTATSIAASGLNIGMALAYVFSSQFVPSSTNHVEIQDGLKKTILVQAIICSLTIIATVLDFEVQPPSPPSQSKAELQEEESTMTFYESICSLMKNRSYMFTLLSGGLVTGVLYTFFSLLNDIILYQFPGSERNMGWMGFLGSMIGIPGMHLAGYLLDKTNAFKHVCISCIALIALTTLGFTFAVKYSTIIVLPFVLIALFGFLTSALQTITMVLAVELTCLTVAEVYSTGMLLSTGCLFGTIFLGINSYAISAVSVEFVNWFMTGACFLGFCLSVFIKAEYPRVLKDIQH